MIYGKGVSKSGHLIKNSIRNIHEAMRLGGFETEIQKFIEPAVVNVQFGTALNRIVTGSMNDLVNHAVHSLRAEHNLHSKMDCNSMTCSFQRWVAVRHFFMANRAMHFVR